MLIITLLMCIIMAILALINWKLPKKSADRWLRVICMTLILVSTFSLMFNINFIDDPLVRLLISNHVVLAFSITFSVLLPSLFFTTDYLQYKKNSKDIKTIEKTLKIAIVTLGGCLITTLVIIINIFIYFY